MVTVCLCVNVVHVRTYVYTSVIPMIFVHVANSYLKYFITHTEWLLCNDDAVKKCKSAEVNNQHPAVKASGQSLLTGWLVDNNLAISFQLLEIC